MRFFLDTEFYDDGRTIDLISIGVVDEANFEFYAQNAEFDWSRVPEDHWIQENVRPHLWVPTHSPLHRQEVWVSGSRAAGGHLPRGEIARQLHQFVSLRRTGEPEFWSYYADYDWIAVCQLYGDMKNLPAGWPMLCLDIEQYRRHLGSPSTPEHGGTEHHALADAYHHKRLFHYLEFVDDERTFDGR